MMVIQIDKKFALHESKDDNNVSDEVKNGS